MSSTSKAKAPFAIEVALAKRAKRVGVTQEEFVAKRTAAFEASAKAGDWKRSELAMSLADVELAAEAVYNTTKRPR